MHDSAVMRVRDRVTHLQQDLDSTFDALDRSWCSLCQPSIERCALNGLHREVGNAVAVDRELVNRIDARMLELSRHLRFGDECVAIERLARERLVESLERNVSKEIAIHGRM